MTTGSTTNINICISQAPIQETVRKRISIPGSDSAVQDWWDAQVDPSTSVRLLIHEEARTHGYVDRVNRIGTSPLPSSSPVADPRDAEINKLREEVAALRETLAPVLPFLGVLATSNAA